MCTVLQIVTQTRCHNNKVKQTNQAAYDHQRIIMSNQVNVYNPEGDENRSTGEFIQCLTGRISRTFGKVRFRTVGRQEITGDKPLLVICNNYSRIGTDINHAVAEIKDVLNSNRTAVCVLHVQQPHVQTLSMPTDNLFDEEFTRLGKLIDFAFTREDGMYRCKMNEVGQEKLMEFLRPFLSVPNPLMLMWYIFKENMPVPLTGKKTLAFGVVALVTLFLWYRWSIQPVADDINRQPN